MKLNYYPLRKNNKDNNVIITPLFHWLFTRGAGNIGQYFAAAWPGKIFANYSLRGRKLLENVQKVSKIAKNVTF